MNDAEMDVSALAIDFSSLALLDDITLQIPQYLLYTVVRWIPVRVPRCLRGCHVSNATFRYVAAAMVALLYYALGELTTVVFQGNPFYTNVFLLVLVLTSS